MTFVYITLMRCSSPASWCYWTSGTFYRSEVCGKCSIAILWHQMFLASICAVPAASILSEWQQLCRYFFSSQKIQFYFFDQNFQARLFYANRKIIQLKFLDGLQPCSTSLYPAGITKLWSLEKKVGF